MEGDLFDLLVTYRHKTLHAVTQHQETLQVDTHHHKALERGNTHRHTRYK